MAGSLVVGSTSTTLSWFCASSRKNHRGRYGGSSELSHSRPSDRFRPSDLAPGRPRPSDRTVTLLQWIYSTNQRACRQQKASWATHAHCCTGFNDWVNIQYIQCFILGPWMHFADTVLCNNSAEECNFFRSRDAHNRMLYDGAWIFMQLKVLNCLWQGEDTVWVTVKYGWENPSADDWIAVFSPADFM